MYNNKCFVLFGVVKLRAGCKSISIGVDPGADVECTWHCIAEIGFVYLLRWEVGGTRSHEVDGYQQLREMEIMNNNH